MVTYSRPTEKYAIRKKWWWNAVRVASEFPASFVTEGLSDKVVDGKVVRHSVIEGTSLSVLSCVVSDASRAQNTSKYVTIM